MPTSYHAGRLSTPPHGPWYPTVYVRAVVQRVFEASVVVRDEVVGAIGGGLLVYLAAGKLDDDDAVRKMAQKIVGLRIFRDDEGKMSRSVLDVGGGVLVVSQFTLFGDVRKGRRPSFQRAADPANAEVLYEALVREIEARGVPVATGTFRAMMEVRSRGDGPVTILIDTEKVF